MISKETLTFLSLSNPVLQYTKHDNRDLYWNCQPTDFVRPSLALSTVGVEMWDEQLFTRFIRNKHTSVTGDAASSWGIGNTISTLATEQLTRANN